jgi:hypothetical protein
MVVFVLKFKNRREVGNNGEKNKEFGEFVLKKVGGRRLVLWLKNEEL